MWAVASGGGGIGPIVATFENGEGGLRVKLSEQDSAHGARIEIHGRHRGQA